jgi:16S rRNA processing protein RimM
LSTSERRISVGRVGKAHGLDGSFYVVGASHPLPEGMSLAVAGDTVRIERRAGTAQRPLIRVSGVADRDGVARIVGEPLMAELADAPLESDEWLSEDLVGCEVVGVGKVTGVVAAPSCDLLEVGPDAVLIPFISDAVKQVDLDNRRIEVDHAFLGLDGPPPEHP